MGSIVSSIHDDYKEYLELCKELKVDPYGDREKERNFYDHWELLKDGQLPETDCRFHGKLGSRDGKCPRC